jgi:hypothetical protein
VSVKTNYNVTLLTINRSDYYDISLELKEEDGGVGLDDIVESKWRAEWLAPNEEPAGNAFPYTEPDSPTLSKWYLGKNGNVNMFAIWENI